MPRRSHSSACLEPQRRHKAVLATVEEFGIRIAVKQRKDSPYLVLEHTVSGKRNRVSTGTTDLETAKTDAKQLAKTLFKSLHGEELGLPQSDRTASPLRLGDVFDVARKDKLPLYPRPRPGTTASWGGTVERALRVFEAVWGRSTPVLRIDQRMVEQFVIRRAECTLEWDTAPSGERGHGGRPASVHTAEKDFQALNTIFNWATKVKQDDGSRLLNENPLNGLNLPRGPGFRCQPVSDAARYQAMLIGAVHAESEGRKVVGSGKGRRHHSAPGYKLMLLKLIHGTGRRVSAVSSLQRQDVLLTAGEIMKAAEAFGLPPKGTADAWIHGALRFSAEWDKMDRPGLVPLTRQLCEDLRQYLMDMPDKRPTAWLFCMPTDPARPLAGGPAEHAIRTIEVHAKVSHMEGGLAHPFRREFRSVRLGFFADEVVALVCGWKPSSKSVMNSPSYLGIDPMALRYCVEFDPGRHAKNRTAGVYTDFDLP